MEWWRAEIGAGRVPRCDAELEIPPPAVPPSADAVNDLLVERDALEAEKKQVWDAGGDWKSLTAVGVRRSQVESQIAKASTGSAAYPELRAAWERAPKSFICGAPVKPDIVFFGEAVSPRFSYLAERDGPEADLLLVMGTSLAVMPFAGILGRTFALECPSVLLIGL